MPSPNPTIAATTMNLRPMMATDVGRQRRGILAPAVAVCLLVVLACVALILDRLWLQAAHLELWTAAEAAALAAGQELADDGLLRTNSGGSRRLDAARSAAAAIARKNRVAGIPVRLDSRSEDDIRFGRLVRQPRTGATVFLETDHHPTTIVVAARRTRARGNPVALFLRELTGQPAGDVVAIAEASIDNRVVGVRPFAGTPVPALPIAILLRQPEREDTWEAQIVEGRGPDRYACDESTGRIVGNPDGLPEIVLHSMPTGGASSAANMQFVDLGSDLRSGSLAKQIARGWAAEDLADWRGELRFDRGPVPLTSSAAVIGEPVDALRQTVGQCRIGLLYQNHRPSGTTGLGRLDCVGVIAGRIMDVRIGQKRACEIIFQPGVLTTPTALLTDDAPDSAASKSGRNPYIYKLHLTQ